MRIPAVSTPVRWDEVERAAGDDLALRFGPSDVVSRLDEEGDLFLPVLKLRRQLPKG
jgi:DNA primase